MTKHGLCPEYIYVIEYISPFMGTLSMIVGVKSLLTPNLSHSVNQFSVDPKFRVKDTSVSGTEVVNTV